MLQKNYFMVFERYIPELKKYDGILFLHQPMTSGQPLKIVQRCMYGAPCRVIQCKFKNLMYGKTPY